MLELVVAVAILSIGIVTILQAFSFCATAAGLSGDITNAVLLSRDKIEELEFKESQRLLSAQAPETKGTQGKFSWIQALTLEPESGLYKSDLSIHWERARKKESLETTAFFVR